VLDGNTWGVLSLREERVLFGSSDWLRVESGSRELEGVIFGRIRWIGWMVGDGLSSDRRRRGMLYRLFFLSYRLMESEVGCMLLK